MARKKVERNISYDNLRKKYYVNLDFGIDPETGRQAKQTKTFAKLTEARAALRHHETERDKGQTVIPKELTLGQWLDDWLQNIVTPNREATTVYGYQKIIHIHLIPAMGNIPLQKLSPQQIQRYYAAKIRKEKLSPNTVRKHHDLLSAALKMAVRQDLLISNPIEKVMPPRKTPVEISFYSPEELKRLLNLVKGDRLEVVVKLAGYLGLHREEILGLTWDNVDFEHRLIFIRQARTAAGSKIVEKTPKNTTSSRTLHMAEDLYEVLKREQAKQVEYRDYFEEEYRGQGFVFAMRTENRSGRTTSQTCLPSLSLIINSQKSPSTACATPSPP